MCHEFVHTGKRGPRKTLKKGMKVRMKNKDSQSHKNPIYANVAETPSLW
jgi:hypothetical protein